MRIKWERQCLILGETFCCYDTLRSFSWSVYRLGVYGNNPVCDHQRAADLTAEAIKTHDPTRLIEWLTELSILPAS